MPTPLPALPVPVSSQSPLTLPAFRRLVYAQVCFGIAYSTFLILPKYLTAHGVGPGRMSWVMAAAALTNVVGLPLLTWMGRRLPGRSALVLGNILMAVGAGGFALL